MSKRSLDRMAMIAAGALAGGAADSAEEAAMLAADCHECLRDIARRRTDQPDGSADEDDDF